MKTPKVMRSLRLDAELVDYFERGGNFSAAVNNALHVYITLVAMDGGELPPSPKREDTAQQALAETLRSLDALRTSMAKHLNT